MKYAMKEAFEKAINLVESGEQKNEEYEKEYKKLGYSFLQYLIIRNYNNYSSTALEALAETTYAKKKSDNIHYISAEELIKKQVIDDNDHLAINIEKQLPKQHLISFFGYPSDNHRGIFDKKVLRKYFALKTFAREENGLDAWNNFINAIKLAASDDTQNHINIFLDAHGGRKNGEYHIEVMHKEMIDKNDDFPIASEILTKIAEASNGKSVNILLKSCYSGNIHQDTNLLPNGSSVMSLSDKDQTVFAKDYSYPEMIEFINECIIHRYKMKVPSDFILTLKDLICIAAGKIRISENTPIISKKVDEKVVKFNFENFVEKIKKNPKAPESIAKLHKLLLGEEVKLDLEHTGRIDKKLLNIDFCEKYIIKEDDFFEYKKYFVGNIDNIKNTDFILQQGLKDYIEYGAINIEFYKTLLDSSKVQKLNIDGEEIVHAELPATNYQIALSMGSTAYMLCNGESTWPNNFDEF